MNATAVIARFWSLAAPLYDQRCLQRWVYQPAQDEVIAQLRRHGSRQIADIACGTGILTSRIQRELQPDEVYGIDMADGMLAQARKRSDRVRWMSAPAEKLPFTDGFLDAVVTTSAFHFFDQPAALKEFRRVLAPGGLVVATTISPGARAVRTLFTDAGFTIADQRGVRRPMWTPISDLLTVGVKPPQP
ncbi:methyltransferase, UbiE/COQ5 family protein [Mycolicibacterium canariasense]|uniref:Methyltransferase, UbiE/COQ5 family protein n=1 Tax=Mycolicibacterium canariasense TaxID=228230 RepID=A0A100WH72_MYCCR|nr:class I SAM-dependent methyltransferase [Mycolicibacterium canariasense]MCV7209750.1 class I SAM-dependent methyltransferase [Mycolicibacterium canariasense]ORU99653.1 SAM-dependent methyltransferase [Mycolicibacterium canariasense]GAS97763.1 methyltransferase, UbiE/COQ5 family protein [Mycolicibacterium canariasense]